MSTRISHPYENYVALHTTATDGRVAMERVSRAFLFHEDLATQDEDASLEEALDHVLWYVRCGARYVALDVPRFRGAAPPGHPVYALCFSFSL